MRLVKLSDFDQFIFYLNEKNFIQVVKNSYFRIIFK